MSAQESSPTPVAGVSFGHTTFEPSGFLDWISEWRTATTTDSISTKFGSIPLTPTDSAAVTSVAHSRVMLRSMTVLGAPADFISYIEADCEQPVGRAPFRWRQYWGELRVGRWRLLCGQAWSLLRRDRFATGPICSAHP